MNWLPATVGDACLPTSQTDPARSGSTTFRYVDIAGIDRDAKAISRADELPCTEAPSRARKAIRAGDVLVSTVRPNLNAVALVPEQLDGEIASTGFAVLRANPDLLHSRFLFYWAQHREFVDFLVANATGASYPAVTDGVVRRARLPLATPKEQSRIVEILDEADRLRRLRREADAKAARILPVLFLKMFGDPATNPDKWPSANLDSVAEIISGATKGRQLNGSKTVELPYMRVANVKDGYLDLSSIKTIEIRGDEIEKYRLQKGDLLMTEGGDPDKLGRAAIWSGEIETCLHQNHIFKVRVNREILESEYLRELVGSAYGKAYFFGVAKKTTSHKVRSACDGSVNTKSTRLRRLGNISATGKPASPREVMMLSSTSGCCASKRNNSTPVYPVPPTMPTLIFLLCIT